ncbi:hypothetical protein Tco_0395299 [Tanacetum coccineum]
MSKSESIREESAVKPEPELKNTIECNLNPSDGLGKPNSINYEDCEDQMGPQSISTAHLCAFDKDCEDFELNELRDHAYENSLIYKAKTKRLHDSKIKNHVFNIGD